MDSNFLKTINSLWSLIFSSSITGETLDTKLAFMLGNIVFNITIIHKDKMIIIQKY